MKIQYILRSILFSLLILPLFQSYGAPAKIIKINPKGTIIHVTGSVAPNSATVIQGETLVISTTGEFADFKGFDENEKYYRNNEIAAVFEGNEGYIPPISVENFPLAYHPLGEEDEENFLPRFTGSCMVTKVPAGANRILFSTNLFEDDDVSDYGDVDNDFKVLISKLSDIVAKIKVKSTTILQGPSDRTSAIIPNKTAVFEVILQKIDNLSITPSSSFSIDPDMALYLNGSYLGELKTGRCFMVNSVGTGIHQSNCEFSTSDFDTNDEMRVWVEIPNINVEPELGHMLQVGITVHRQIGRCLYPIYSVIDAETQFQTYVDNGLLKVHTPKIGLVRMEGVCPIKQNTSLIPINRPPDDPILFRFDINSCTVPDEDSDDNPPNYTPDPSLGPTFQQFNTANLQELSAFKTLYPIPESAGVFFYPNINFSLPIIDTIKNFQAETEKALKLEISDEVEFIDKVKLALTRFFVATSINKISSKIAFKKLDYAIVVANKNFFQKFLGYDKHVPGVVFYKPTLEKIAFIRSDQVNSGVILHELGHVLGQRKEFYRKKDKNGNFLLDSAQDQCTAGELGFYKEFSPNKLDLAMPCYKFKNNFRRFDGSTFREEKVANSVMGGSQNNTIQNKTVDLSTYRIALRTLQNAVEDPQMIVLSGVYAFDRIFDTKVEHYGFGRLLPSDNTGDIQVNLKDANNQILNSHKTNSIVRPHIESLDGTEEDIQYSVAPVFATLPYSPKATTIEVIKDGNVLFSKKLPTDSKPEHLFSSNNSHSTEQNFPVLKHTATVELLEKEAVKDTSSAFTKFKYDPGFKMSFGYNACSNDPTSEDGIALLLGKNPADYTAEKLKNGNQGVKFNNKGLSLHLNMNKRISLKDGGGQTLTSTKYNVDMACNEWKVLKLTIDEDNKLTLTQKDTTLLSHDLTQEQIEKIANWPIGFNAFSKENGQYKVRNVKIMLLDEEEEELEE